LITLDLNTDAKLPIEERIHRIRFAQAFCLAGFLLLLWPYYHGVSSLHSQPSLALRFHDARISIAEFLAMLGLVFLGLFLQIWEVKLKQTKVPRTPVRNGRLRRGVLLPIVSLVFLSIAAAFLGQDLSEYLWPGSKSNWLEPVIVLSYAFGPFFKDLSRKVRLPHFFAVKGNADAPLFINALALFTILLACGIVLMFGIHFLALELWPGSAPAIQMITGIPVLLAVVVSWALLIPLDRIFEWA